MGRARRVGTRLGLLEFSAPSRGVQQLATEDDLSASRFRESAAGLVEPARACHMQLAGRVGSLDVSLA